MFNPTGKALFTDEMSPNVCSCGCWDGSGDGHGNCLCINIGAGGY